MWPAPVTLRGPDAALVPLSPEHASALATAASDGELWNLWYANVPEPAGMGREIDRRLSLQQAGAMLPFTVLDAAGVPVGMTAYLNVDAVHRRVEIGGTWYARRMQRTVLNTACKRLLLAHAFEALDCIAVEFRTSTHNAASRRAIERLGAKLDGVLRHHVRHRDGSLRDTCVYSITAPEWPAARARLDALLAR